MNSGFHNATSQLFFYFLMFVFFACRMFLVKNNKRTNTTYKNQYYPTLFQIDFKNSIITLIKQIKFPTAIVRGCYLQFEKAIYKNFKENWLLNSNKNTNQFNFYTETISVVSCGLLNFSRSFFIVQYT